MEVKLKDNCITINNKSLFIVVNNDGDFNLGENDNFTVTSNSDECTINLDLSKNESEISFMGLIKFTYGKITYTSYFFWIGEDLLNMIIHLPNGDIVQYREVGIELSDDKTGFTIKYNTIKNEKTEKVVSDIKHNTRTLSEKLFDIIRGYSDEKLGPITIEVGSSLYVLEN